MAIFTTLAIGIGLLVANGIKNELVDAKLEGDARGQGDEAIAEYDSWMANRQGPPALEMGEAPSAGSEDQTGKGGLDDAMDQLA